MEEEEEEVEVEVEEPPQETIENYSTIENKTTATSKVTETEMVIPFVKWLSMLNGVSMSCRNVA